MDDALQLVLFHLLSSRIVHSRVSFMTLTLFVGSRLVSPRIFHNLD